MWPMARASHQRVQRGRVEHLRHQAHVLVDPHCLPVGHRDSRGFLAPVLQRVDAEEGELGSIDTRCRDTDDPALFFRRIEFRVDVVHIATFPVHMASS